MLVHTAVFMYMVMIWTATEAVEVLKEGADTPYLAIPCSDVKHVLTESHN